MCPSPIRESLRSFVAAVRSSRPGKWGGHRDELPASHSITSSARASSVGGIPPVRAHPPVGGIGYRPLNR
jgi:hypothetical protein